MTQDEIKQSIERLVNLFASSQNLEAKSLAYELLEQQAIQQDAKSLIIVCNHLGRIYAHLSDFPKALEYFSKALHINQESGNSVGITSNLGNIGLTYIYLSDYPKAIEHLEKALQLHEEIGNKEGIAANLSNIGGVYLYLSDYARALEYYENSLRICKEIGNKEGIAINLSNIGGVYLNLSDYTKTLEYYSKALHINEEMEKKDSIANNLGNIGNVYLHLADYPKALEYNSKALQIKEELGNRDGIANNLGNIGVVYSKLSDYTKALEYVKRAYALSLEIGTKNVTMEQLLNLSHIYKDIGDIANAFSYFKQYIEIKEEIQSEESKKQSMLFDQRRKIQEDDKDRQLKLARFQEQERIFHNILPFSIADRLIEGEQTIAESFENVSIFFSDIVNFTALSANIEPAELVQGLNTIFTAFDRIGTNYGLEKIKTIGDAYMAVCGVPESYEDHAKRAAHFALEAKEVLSTLDLSEQFKLVQIRFGLHSGSVVAGIIGEKKFAYDVWGDAVNIASRMESNSEAGRIHISEKFAKSIEHHPEFSLISRGEISIKGKGTMQTYWLERAK